MTAVRWTAAEDATLRRMWAAGATHEQIGVSLGRSAYSVERRANRMRLGKRGQSHLRVSVDADRLVSLLQVAPRIPYARIAEQLGCSLTTVHRRAAEIGMARHINPDRAPVLARQMRHPA